MDFASVLGNSSVIAKICMFLPVLVVGMSVVYAVHPDERRLALMRPLSLAAIFAGLFGFSVGAISILQGIGATETMAGNWRHVALAASEAIVPLFITFGCLTVSWLIVAFGMRTGLRG